MTRKDKKLHTEQFEKIANIVAPELHLLIEDHYETYKIMENVRNKGDEASCNIALNRIKNEVEQHFQYEEKFVLPKLNKYFIDDEIGPIAKLIQDHRYIEEKYNYIMGLLAKNNLTEEIINEIKVLAYLIKKHIEKEDNYIFPLLSIILSEDEKKEIKTQLTKAKKISN